MKNIFEPVCFGNLQIKKQRFDGALVAKFSKTVEVTFAPLK